ncbi:MAG: M28 family peptidase [Bacteroidales bacterium]|nr:M28 family peptidase [Bacteroidales bacterium]
MKNYLIILVLAIYSFSCTTGYRKAESTINESDMTRIVTEFASDEFQGRKPFTSGEDKAVAFLEKEYKRIGLEPANNGSYIQEVPMVEVTNSPDKRMKINLWNAAIELNHEDDFVAFSKQLTDNIKVRNSEMIFVGYGIVAPEYNWNDYEGINVKGKTVVVLVNDPGFGTENKDFFKGNEMTYYGRWTYKYEEAARQGAKGVFIIHENDQAGYPWSVVLNGATIPKLYLQPEDNYMSMCALEGWLTLNAATELFSLAGKNLTKLKDKAKTLGFKAVRMNARLNLNIKSTHKFATSRNVIGILPGTERGDEVIIYSSHWDHLGIGPVVNGDSIYNGAVDNGTTTAWMLEIAEAFANLKKKPKRTIMFFSPTAEEQGLKGSEYYAKNPLFPLNKTVANINNDLMLPYGPYKDVMITGYGQSELEDYIVKFAKEYDRYIMPDPNPHTGMYYRADHFSFANAGVPALFARGNCDSREHGKEWALKKEKQWLNNNYHKQTDQYDPDSWTFEGIVEDARLFFRIGFELSNESTFPEWKEGSEFREKRLKQMKEE